MQKLLKKLWSNIFFRGGVFYTASSFLANIMNYLFNLIAGRSLGPAGYGELTVLFSYLTVLTVPMVIFSNFLIQKIAETEHNTLLAKSLENVLWTYIKKWFWIIPILFLLTPLISTLTNLSFFLSFTLVLFVLLTIISSVYNSLLQGLQLFFIFSILGVVLTFIKLLGAVAVLLGLDGIVTIIFFLFLSTILGILVNIRVFHNHIQLKSIHVQSIPLIEKKLIPLFRNPQFQIISLSTLALTIFNNVDVMFVQKYFTPFEVGIYSSWSLFSKIILYFLGPFIAISFIFFSSRQSHTTERKTLHISLCALLIVGIVSFFVYKYLAITIISIFFGHKFYAVAPYLEKASIFGSLYTGITFINNYFLAKKSWISSISFLSIFVYIVFLFFVKKTLASVMDLNIMFSAALFLTYVVLYIKFFLFQKKK